MSVSTLEDISRRVGVLREETLGSVAQVVVGMESVTLQLLTALIAGGHVLLEGVPGTAKTTLCRTFSHILGIDYKPRAVHA